MIIKSKISSVLLLTVLSLTLVCSSDDNNNDDNTDNVATEIFMYAANNGAGVTGNLGGRTGADMECSDSKPSALTCTRIRAYLSVDADDEIRDMPDNYDFSIDIPIRGGGPMATTGMNLADSFSDLMMDGLSMSSPTNTKQELGIPTTGPDYAYSGGGANEAVSSNNCNGWTSNASSDMGTLVGAFSGRWLGFDMGVDNGGCDGMRFGMADSMTLLCLCW